MMRNDFMCNSFSMKCQMIRIVLSCFNRSNFTMECENISLVLCSRNAAQILYTVFWLRKLFDELGCMLPCPIHSKGFFSMRAGSQLGSKFLLDPGTRRGLEKVCFASMLAKDKGQLLGQIFCEREVA